jgi:hypothetical protein
LTKQDDLLKNPIDETLDTTTLELTNHLTDNTLHIHTPIHINLDKVGLQPKNCLKTPNLTTITKNNPIEKATNQLYNIENYTTPEKTLNINLNLYQMEDY